MKAHLVETDFRMLASPALVGDDEIDAYLLSAASRLGVPHPSSSVIRFT